MFAVVQLGSTQYLVQENQEILVDRMPLEEGKNFMFEKVLLLAESDKGNVLIGTPNLDHVKVEARVMGEEKGEKIRVFKMKSKKRYQRTVGFRAKHTRLKILKISVLSAGAKVAKTVEEPAPLMTEAPKKAPAKKPAAKKTPVKKVAKAE